MKLRNLFFASVALCMFAACSSENEPEVPPTGEAASLVVDFGSVITKTYTNAQTADEAKMTNVIVTVQGTGYNENQTFGTLDGLNENKVSFDGLVKGGTYTVTVDVKGAAKNYPNVTWDEETLGNFTMYKSQEITLTDAENTATIEVDRTVARIDFESLAVDFNKEDKLLTNATSFTVRSIEIINKATAANATQITSNPNPAFGDDGLFTDFTGVINNTEAATANGADQNGIGQMYVLPNTSSNKQTSIVIKGTINTSAGANIESTYTIPIESVKGNTIYKINATIKGTGTTVPASIEFTIKAAEWDVVDVPAGEL